MPDLPALEHSMVAASVAGGAASAIVNRGPDGAWRKIADGIGGALVGVFAGPAIADLAGAKQDNIRVAIALGVAATGAILLTLLIDQAKGITLREWIARFLGTPPGKP